MEPVEASIRSGDVREDQDNSFLGQVDQHQSAHLSYPAAQTTHGQHETKDIENIQLEIEETKLKKVKGYCHDQSSAPSSNLRDISDSPPPVEHLSDLIKNHYNSRQNRTRHVRMKSPIINLRCFNNWVKFALIYKGLDMYVSSGKKLGLVFDIAAGKGGDLGKWMNTGVQHLVLTDIATTSLEHSMIRYNHMRPPFSATFISSDCCKLGIQKHLNQLDYYYDMVSCQFALHYSFETEERAMNFMSNITYRLAPGGIFICTIPDERIITERLRNSKSMHFGNDIYQVSFLSQDHIYEKKKFGREYTFSLKDAVDNVPEYVVQLDVLNELAALSDMELIYESNFGQFYQTHRHTDAHALYKMGVPSHIDTNDPVSWEAALLYRLVIYRKKEDLSWRHGKYCLPTVGRLCRQDIIYVND